MGQKPSNTTTSTSNNGTVAAIRACTPSSGPVPSFVVLLRGLKVTHMDWSSDAVKAAIVKERAALLEDIKESKKDVKKFAKSLEWHDEWGMNALLFASYHGTIDVVREIIDAGADLNCANQHGLTPLIMAASRGHTNVGLLLIKAGADLSKKDAYGVTISKWGNPQFTNIVTKEAIRSIVTADARSGQAALLNDVMQIVLQYLGSVVVSQPLEGGAWLCETCLSTNPRNYYHCQRPQCHFASRDISMWPIEKGETLGWRCANYDVGDDEKQRFGAKGTGACHFRVPNQWECPSCRAVLRDILYEKRSPNYLPDTSTVFKSSQRLDQSPLRPVCRDPIKVRERRTQRLAQSYNNIGSIMIDYDID